MINSENFVTNAEFVEAMNALKSNQSQENWNRFSAALDKAHFLVPIKKNKKLLKKLGKHETTDDISLDIIDLHSPNGERFFPAFTSWEELIKGKYEVPIDGLVLAYKVCEDAVKKKEKWKGTVINPYTQSIVLRSDNTSPADGRTDSLQKDTSVMIGEPASYPDGILDALKQLFARSENVKRAFFLQMVKGSDDISYLLIIDAENSIERILGEVGQIAQKCIVNNIALDCVPYSTGFARSATEGRDPFYSRG